MDETGYIKNIPGTSKTSREGVLQRVMLLIRSIGKPSPQPEADVWPPWMPNAISRQRASTDPNQPLRLISIK